ncbi:hypothetical protein LguiA_004791 [Lonicera macranthoides]
MTDLTQLVLADNNLSSMVPMFQAFVTVDTHGKDLINSTTLNTRLPEEEANCCYRGGGWGSRKRFNLDLLSHYSIAIEVAQDLAFLHGSTSGPILLLDLSSKSILLKSLMEPQVGDIEVYKVIDPSKSTGSLSAVAGSVGYIPPKYAYTMIVTMAGNIYSFGVILLELVTGKAGVSEGIELAKWVSSKSTRKGKWDHILDYSSTRYRS